MSKFVSVELRTKISSAGRLAIWLEKVQVEAPGVGEVLVRIDAAPLNPADMLVLLGPVDPARIESSWLDGRLTASAQIDPERLGGLASRLDQVLPVGSEGAGVVVAAGKGAEALIGRTVALRSPLGTYAQYRVARAQDCLLIAEGVAPEQAASAIINPQTVLGMVETMRQEGHRALVHTAAASNVGQMLNRLCLKENIPLLNIVRDNAQVETLKQLGARFVLDSTSTKFEQELIEAVAETGATLAFDAIGGGTMAGAILRAMEAAIVSRADAYSRYGSAVHKQVYIYGVLNSGPRILEGNFGSAWGVGGWLMTWFYEKLDLATAARLRKQASDELTTTFASAYTSKISLSDVLKPEVIVAFSRRATGQKFLICPNA